MAFSTCPVLYTIRPITYKPVESAAVVQSPAARDVQLVGGVFDLELGEPFPGQRAPRAAPELRGAAACMPERRRHQVIELVLPRRLARFCLCLGGEELLSAAEDLGRRRAALLCHRRRRQLERQEDVLRRGEYLPRWQ